jgi:hypothetical protein
MSALFTTSYLSDVIYCIISAFQAYAVLAGDEAVGFELARKYMDDFLAETLVCSNALAFLEASR